MIEIMTAKPTSILTENLWTFSDWIFRLQARGSGELSNSFFEQKLACLSAGKVASAVLNEVIVKFVNFLRIGGS